ncbi:MAG: alpha/beta hydrolase [Planctomycetota bacterium]|nr:alpha/beta hydrolase [Planctomycetota bacterium]
MPTKILIQPIFVLKLLFAFLVFPLLAFGQDQGQPSGGKPAKGELSGIEHGFADSDGIKIHYASLGKGPLVILIHGFPDYWYTWRKQMPELAKNYQVVAIDQRGYNRSDQPKGVENYAMSKLVADVEAVIRHFDQEKAVIAGHDWGGAVAWSFAMTRPKMTDRLVILNLPHPRGMRRELKNNPEQQKNSQYARDFQKPGAEKFLTAKGLSGWVKGESARKKYVAAFERSSFSGMLNYYRANYPRVAGASGEGEPSAENSYPRIQCPVLMFHGLKDKALHANGLNQTWEWVEKDLTIVTVPNAGHFVQQDASTLVTRRMSGWLKETRRD